MRRSIDRWPSRRARTALVGGALAGALLVSAPMALVGVAYIYLRIKGENPPVPT